MTTTNLGASAAPAFDFDSDNPNPPSGPKVWLAWSTAAAGFVALAASLALSLSGAKAEPVASTAYVVDAEGPLVAVVLDDVGLDLAAARRAIALPAPVTLALLPYAPQAAAIDGEARRAGRETIVHLPMEPMGLEDPGPGALTTWLSPEQIRERTERAFAKVPGASGVSNHMGSRFTTCAACVEPVVEAAAERRVFVLDSRTTSASILAETAHEAGAETIARDVFLDNDADVEAVLVQLRRAERIARVRGEAVAIGHPHPGTLEALEIWIPEAQARGIVVAPVGAAVARNRRAEQVQVAARF